MTRTKALKAALKAAGNGITYFVYHWTDDPGYPGPKDYHIVSDGDYYCDPSCAWIEEDMIVFNTAEGWY